MSRRQARRGGSHRRRGTSGERRRERVSLTALVLLPLGMMSVGVPAASMLHDGNPDGFGMLAIAAFGLAMAVMAVLSVATDSEPTMMGVLAGGLAVAGGLLITGGARGGGPDNGAYAFTPTGVCLSVMATLITIGTIRALWSPDSH